MRHAWLASIAGSLKCANCARPYARADLYVVAEDDAYVFVRCECRACRREGVAVVLVEYARPSATRRPPISVDDVLNAHDALAGYEGDLQELLLAAVR